MQFNKKLLQQAADDDVLRELNKLADTLVSVWMSGSGIRETEFLTLQETIKREERKEALKLFLQELERLAHE